MNPKWNRACIDGRQMLCLLVVGRVFSVMVYSPGKTAVDGTVTLAAQLPALAVELLLLVPWFRASKRLGRSDLPHVLCAKSPAAGRLCAAVCLGFCLFLAVHSLTVQTDFLTGTIYHTAGRGGILLALWAGTVYGVWLGPEAFARLSMGVFVLLALVLAGLAVQVLPQIDLLNLHHPLVGGGISLLQGTLTSVGRCAETGTALLLLPQVRKDGSRWARRSVLFWTGATAAVAFLTQTVLGNFAALRAYPVYSLALAAGETAVFGRMDALLLAVWVFLAVVRGSLYLWLGAGFCSLLCRQKPAVCMAVCAGAALALALAAPMAERLWQEPYLGGGLLASVTLAVPAATLLAAGKGEKQP